MKIKLDSNGDLLIQADDVEERDRLAQAGWHAMQGGLKPDDFERVVVAEMFTGLRWIEPEVNGDLTAAPIVTNGPSRWGFMDYQVRSFVDDLIQGLETRWVLAR